MVAAQPRSTDKITLLIVDDDDIDARVIQRGLKKHQLDYPTVVARDGIEALEFLRGRQTAELDDPLLVLLDLNMPRMNGHEFLREIRNDPDLCRLLVFVLTTSDADRDIDAAYQHNVAGYLLKQSAGPNFADHAKLFQSYIQQVQFPESTVR